MSDQSSFNPKFIHSLKLTEIPVLLRQSKKLSKIIIQYIANKRIIEELSIQLNQKNSAIKN